MSEIQTKTLKRSPEMEDLVNSQMTAKIGFLMLNGFKMVDMAHVPLVSMLGMVHAHIFITDSMAWFGRPTIVQRHSYFQTSAENSANTHVFDFCFSPLISDEMT